MQDNSRCVLLARSCCCHPFLLLGPVAMLAFCFLRGRLVCHFLLHKLPKINLFSGNEREVYESRKKAAQNARQEIYRYTG